MCNKGICKLEVHVFFVDFMHFIYKLPHCKYTCIIPNAGRPLQLPQVISLPHAPILSQQGEAE